MAVPESEWDEGQRALMVALAVWRSGLCRRCGGELAETTDPAHDRDNPQGSHLYRATRRVRCHKCTVLMDSEHQHTANTDVPYPAAVQHYADLVPRTPPVRVPRPPRVAPVLSAEQQARRERRARRR